MTGVYGPKHPNLATEIGSIGNVYTTQELWEEALVEYKVAHELLKLAIRESHHPNIASSYIIMGLGIELITWLQSGSSGKVSCCLRIFQKGHVV